MGGSYIPRAKAPKDWGNHQWDQASRDRSQVGPPYAVPSGSDAPGTPCLMWASQFSLLRPQSSPSSAAAPPSPSLDNLPAGSMAGLCDSVPCSPSQSVEKHLTLTLQEQTLVLLHRLSACPHRSHTVSTSTSGFTQSFLLHRVR